jgi:hypothetical protein
VSASDRDEAVFGIVDVTVAAVRREIAVGVTELGDVRTAVWQADLTSVNHAKVKDRTKHLRARGQSESASPAQVRDISTLLGTTRPSALHAMVQKNRPMQTVLPRPKYTNQMLRRQVGAASH